MQLSDSQDNYILDNKQKEKTARQPNYKDNQNEGLNFKTFNSSVECEVNEDMSSLLTTSTHIERKISSDEENHSKRIDVAVPIITEIALRDKKIQEIHINTVLASMLCGQLVTADSPEGEKALMEATLADKDFVRMAIVTCKKTRKLGGERPEIKKAATQILNCLEVHRDLHKYEEYDIIDNVIDKISDYISRKAIEMTGDEEDHSDDDSDDTYSASYSYIAEKISKFASKKNPKTLGKKSEEEEIESVTTNTTQYVNPGAFEFTSVGSYDTRDIYSDLLENEFESQFDNLEDNSILDSSLQGKSFDTFEHTVKSISSLDTAMRQLSVVDHGNIIDYISYGLAEAVSTCGADLLSTASDVKRDIKKNRLFRH